ncbi:MAG: DEAD/DEAH box helicase [Candidatus Micrarchaeaceae archaeon]
MDDFDLKFILHHERLTEIQKLAFERLKGGGNFLLVAPTGSGKTEAAIVPLLKKINDKKPGIRILYITPLRALNRDIVIRMEALANSMGFSAGARHGDTERSERAKQARKAPELLVTTPETLQSILPTKSIRPQLRNLVAVVIDEVHELYHNKRGAQLTIALERLEFISPGYQRIGLSATVGNANEIMSFISGGRKCELIEGTHTKNVDIKIDASFSGKGKTVNKHEVDSKIGLLADYIRKNKSVLIFGNTRHVVEAIGSRLKEADTELKLGGVGVHHSSLNKDERIDLEKEFKSGKVKCVVATSSLELGIDIGRVDLVIQYGSPRQAIRLMQRVGRSGHGELKVARGVIIPSNPLEAIESEIILSNLKDGSFESFTMQKGALDVLMHQICGIILDFYGTAAKKDIAKIVGGAGAYLNSEINLDELLNFMAARRLVSIDNEKVSSTPMTRMFYYEHLSFISDKKKFTVKSIIDNRTVSFLDEEFVTSYLDEGVTFITKGLPWKVLSIEEDVINVEPSSDREAAIPDWNGEDIPIDYKVAKRLPEFFSKPFNTTVFTGDSKSVSSFIKEQNGTFQMDERRIIIENVGEYTLLHTHLGTLANEALAKIITYFASAKLGHSIVSRSSPYLILLELPRGFDIPSIFKSLKEETLETVLLGAIERSELFIYKFSSVMKFFGIVEKDASVSKSMVRRLIRLFKGTPVYKETVRELLNNYFDIEILKSFIRSLNSGNIRFETINRDALSPIADMVINSAFYSSELMLPVAPDDEMVDSFAEYIMRKDADMICTYCGFRFTRKVSELKQISKLKCQNCGSPMISLYEPNDEKIIEKRTSGKKLAAAEKSRLNDMLAIASLVSEFGWRALFTLETYGIGQASAARVLRMLKNTDREFYLEALEAQRQFIRTRRYWSI